MCGSCFLIHSATLCLLIGAFNPFMFKVIIYRHLFIAIFSYLCSSFSHPFFSFLKADPLASFEDLVWRRCIFWGSFCSLLVGLFILLLGIFLAIPFWLGAFPLRSQLLVLCGLSCMLPPVSPLLPLRFSLSWNFAIIIIMCLEVGLFGFLLIGTVCVHRSVWLFPSSN